MDSEDQRAFEKRRCSPSWKFRPPKVEEQPVSMIQVVVVVVVAVEIVVVAAVAAWIAAVAVVEVVVAAWVAVVVAADESFERRDWLKQWHS